MIDVAIIGHGVVGSGVAEILINHNDLISEKAKRKINLKYILDIRDFDDLPYRDKFIKDFNLILNDESIKVVVEVAGGVTFAYDYVKACLLRGKNVVTSNKELVAAKGAELLRIAMDNNVNFMFEASVGGGIPVLRPIAQCLAANDLTEIIGILNGTTNFVLTKMIKENVSFDDALATAQRLGYAERDPSADIDGADASRKISILASLAFGRHVYPQQVRTVGIRNVKLADVEIIDKMGYATKLIGTAMVLPAGKITAGIYPAAVRKSNIVADVEDVFNIISVRGDSIGDVAFYGRGAGKLPTASAVVADVIDCVKHLSARKYLFWEDGDADYVKDINEIKSDYIIIAPKGTFIGLSDDERNSMMTCCGCCGFIVCKKNIGELEKYLAKVGIEDYHSYRIIY